MASAVNEEPREVKKRKESFFTFSLSVFRSLSPSRSLLTSNFWVRLRLDARNETRELLEFYFRGITRVLCERASAAAAIIYI